MKTIRGAADSFHRLRVGDYRVMFDVISEDRVVLVLGIVHRGDLELWLSGPGSSGRDQDGATPGGWNRIVLEVPDLEEAASGLLPRGERVDGPAGSWRLVEDPWGNPIELFQPK